MVGLIATAKAGHDKGQTYIIIKEELNAVFVSDGKLKPVDNPKKKNKKHLVVCKKQTKEQTQLSVRLYDRMNGKEVSSECLNLEIAKVIKAYKKEM